MHIKHDELTLTQDEIYAMAKFQCESGMHHRELLFQSKANRDAVYKACVALGAKMKRSSGGPHQLDPRYTVEGADIPDRGLANDYKHWFDKLYELKRTL